MSNNGRNNQQHSNTNNTANTTPNTGEKPNNGGAPETTSHANTFDEYDVQVSTSALLNVRTGPGMEYPVVRHLKHHEVVTIVEESADKDSKKGWGRLKSGEEWVNLDFTEPVE